MTEEKSQAGKRRQRRTGLKLVLPTEPREKEDTAPVLVSARPEELVNSDKLPEGAWVMHVTVELRDNSGVLTTRPAVEILSGLDEADGRSSSRQQVMGLSRSVSRQIMTVFETKLQQKFPDADVVAVTGRAAEAAQQLRMPLPGGPGGGGLVLDLDDD